MIHGDKKNFYFFPTINAFSFFQLTLNSKRFDPLQFIRVVQAPLRCEFRYIELAHQYTSISTYIFWFMGNKLYKSYTAKNPFSIYSEFYFDCNIYMENGERHVQHLYLYIRTYTPSVYVTQYMRKLYCNKTKIGNGVGGIVE